MGNGSKRIPPISESQGLWIGISLVIVIIVSLIDWVFSVTFIPINLLVALLTFATLALISGILFIVSLKALSPNGFMGQSELVTTGIYAHIRYPHYLSNMLLSFSVATLFRSRISLFTTFCLVPLTYLLTK